MNKLKLNVVVKFFYIEKIVGLFVVRNSLGVVVFYDM